MKLILCVKCSDVVALRVGEIRRCACGSSWGWYIDELHAEIGGEDVVPLGIANPSLVGAVRNYLDDKKNGIDRDLGHRFEAFTIPHSAPTIEIVNEKKGNKEGTEDGRKVFCKY